MLQNGNSAAEQFELLHITATHDRLRVPSACLGSQPTSRARMVALSNAMMAVLAVAHAVDRAASFAGMRRDAWRLRASRRGDQQRSRESIALL